MAQERNVLLGILSILLGLVVIAFPLISVFVLSSIVGVGLIIIGIWLLAQSFHIWSGNKGLSILALILGVLGIIVGIGLFGKILAFSILVGLVIYIGGLFLIISGLISLISGQGSAGRWGGIFGIIMGILYIIVGLYAFNPLYLALLIGLWLIITGIFHIFTPVAENVES